MNKWLIGIVLAVFPLVIFAQDSGGALSFAPPSGDYSMVFLGNIFGIVDGVLHGSGSQIMGALFGVFNAAVLAIGGIIISYTTVVSTMNTAQEGEMLGHKWSSIWIPLRSTAGLALLIPKASGYCMMQIFVMWIIVQGVGAADKVWNAALSYLNRGGVIIQTQDNPSTMLSGGSGSELATGGMDILVGQVCMLGLQQQLENARQSYLKNDKQPPCANVSYAPPPSAAMLQFCNTPVPSFLNTVNFVSQQQNAGAGLTSYSVQLPQFDGGSPYAFLNGVCGVIKWNAFNQASLNTVTTNINGITGDELDTAKMSRAIALQQMYLDLGMVAQTMVSNDPQLNSTTVSNTFSAIAAQQFGVPHLTTGGVCSAADPKCLTWGQATSATPGAPLFTGTEFKNAINDYDGIMRPTLNLVKQAQDTDQANQVRKFIQKASTKGWIMAGSYFFDLARLNGSATNGNNLIDTESGLGASTPANIVTLTASFAQSGGCASGSGDGSSNTASLCLWLNGARDKVTQVIGLINGSSLPNATVSKPNFSSTSQLSVIDGPGSSTVYGYVNNAMIIQLPGQPGLKPLTFGNMMSVKVDPSLFYLQQTSFGCGEVTIMFFKFCLGGMFGDLLYNGIIVPVYDAFLALFQGIINQVIMAFLMIPLQGLAQIFTQGVQTLTEPGVNPIIALAHMGALYINFAGNLWIEIIELSVVSSLIPIFGIFIFALIGLALPLLTAWLAVMVGVGFITAFYVPVLPYMIFTFGSIAWLMAVIEAMVAAPIVALGVTHPEGEGAFGKGETAIMILLNIFLRPSMMIIGYIAGIALSYVGVWILNAGFDHAISFIQSSKDAASGDGMGLLGAGLTADYNDLGNGTTNGGSGSGGYTSWAGVYALFFSVLIYTTMYLTIVEKAFTLISALPDKVMRWISGGQQESYGAESDRWSEASRGKVEAGGGKTQDAQAAMDKQMSGFGGEAVSAAQGAPADSQGGTASTQEASPSGGGGAAGGGDAAAGAGGAAAGGGAGAAIVA